MIFVPVHDCPCLPPIGCEILRSKYKIPETLSNFTSNIIKGVYSIDGSKVYSEVSLLEKKYNSGAKYTKQKSDFFINNGYLYITHPKNGPKVIAMTAVFEDPIKAEEFQNFCDTCEDCTDCNSPLDYDFPIDLDRIDILIEMCVRELIEVFNALGKEDTVSDNKEDNNK